MATESGDKKLLGNFRKLIDEVSADPNYNPANSKLKKSALEAQYDAGDASASAVSAARAPNKLAITDRETAFSGLRALAVRSRNFLKASGAPKPVTADAETFIRKLSGGRKSPKVKAEPQATPAAPAGETPTTRSSSQMSYDNQVGHFESYIEVVKNVPAYKPNEAELKVAALAALAADLKDKSNTVSTTSATLNQARGQRDRLLYLDEDSIVNTALLVKSYIQAAQGTKSQLYKKVKGLQFARQRKEG
jgi:hypothetical protein